MFFAREVIKSGIEYKNIVSFCNLFVLKIQKNSSFFIKSCKIICICCQYSYKIPCSYFYIYYGQEKMTKKMLAVAALAGVAVLAGCGTHTEEAVVTGDVVTGTESVEMMTGAEEVVTGEILDVTEEATTGAEETTVATGDFVVETVAE